MMNMHYKAMGEQRTLQLSKREEFLNTTNENAKIYKERTETWHDKQIIRKILLFGPTITHLQLSVLIFFLEELKSRWFEPFTPIKLFMHEDVEYTTRPKVILNYTINRPRHIRL